MVQALEMGSSVPYGETKLTQLLQVRDTFENVNPHARFVDPHSVCAFFDPLLFLM